MPDHAFEPWARSAPSRYHATLTARQGTVVAYWGLRRKQWRAHMADGNDEIRRKVNDTNRVNSPLAWAIGGVFLVLLLGGLFFYDGRDGSTKSGSNPPNVVSNSSSTSRQ
jgi:hypothetical protein